MRIAGYIEKRLLPDEELFQSVLDSTCSDVAQERRTRSARSETKWLEVESMVKPAETEALLFDVGPRFCHSVLEPAKERQPEERASTHLLSPVSRVCG